MKVLKKIIFTFAMVAGLALAVSAQKGDDKKPPPKGTPPVVTPQPKNPPPTPAPTPQPDNKKPIKPGYALIPRKSEGVKTA